MCLVAFAHRCQARHPWLLASNRDEFFDRPTAPLAWWRPDEGGPAVLAGRDLSAGGSWLGLTAAGRLALVTNVREPGRFDAAAPSRGALVTQWLQQPEIDAAALAATAQAPRNGFNLLVADLARGDLAWVGNRPPAFRRLDAGLYGLSNAALDTPWPKVCTLKQRLHEALAADAGTDALISAALVALADRQVAPDARLPATGMPIERERLLSPAFIHIDGPDAAAGAVYGTRCSTVVVVEQAAAGRRVHVLERRFDAFGAVSGETLESFALADAAAAA